MKIQDYIKEKGIQSLKDEFDVEVREYPELDLYCLNYSQIASPKHHPVVDQCRGVIVDSAGNIYCLPFDRFYNFGEGNTKDFDFSDCYIAEKADGSLTKVYHNVKTGRWEIGTRGTAFAEANHVFGLKTDWTFREAILDAMRFTEEQFQSCMNQTVFHKSCTYIMEYCSPYNRIVTPYDTPQMVLLGVRSTITGIESSEYFMSKWCEYLQSHGMNVRMPKKYMASSAEAVVKLVDSLEDLQEGVVVRNLNTGQRVKIKNSLYVKVHASRGNGTPSRNNLMEMVLTGEKDEFLTYFPEFSHFFKGVDEALFTLRKDAEMIYDRYKDIEAQKDFALAVKDTEVAAICFKARKEKVTAHHAFESMELNQQMKLLEKYLD